MEIPNKLIQLSKDFAASQAEEFGVPSVFHLDLSYRKGQWLAEKLNANREIVAIGTYLMDCMLGVAFKEGRAAEHVKMSKIKAEELIDGFSITKDYKDNILACVSEHHGKEKFYSLESEICCNADCYRFASVEGFVGGIHHGREMDITDLLNLYRDKANEKWKALSLDICKADLKNDYQAIKQLINQFLP
ncbi:MAG: hypothetical protein COY80_03765 [Candidatus Pacebacteria bacterium CG_4_10_14_0_8_um_filter_42_14]|nr:MAG: hypothetical protein COY80_03765 [Candidatus Pacebacteria bacterium CG_4_10_14_0_8_um_filter_42_14]